MLQCNLIPLLNVLAEVVAGKLEMKYDVSFLILSFSLTFLLILIKLFKPIQSLSISFRLL